MSQPDQAPAPIPATIAAVIFDLDGTLVHSAPDIHAAVAKMLHGLGRPSLTLDEVISFVGNGVPKLLERVLAATGGPGGEAETARELFYDAYRAAPAALTQPYPGVLALLDALKEAELPLGVCTNKPEDFTHVILDQLGLHARFAAIVGGDRLPVKKPDPAPLRLCFEELGVAPADGLYVGDSETDEATAHALGAPFAFFTGGYRKQPVAAFRAAYAFDHFNDLTATLRGRAPS